MSPTRPLLRLDEKMAAETRRLAALPGSPRPLAVLAAILAAAMVHAVLAALPLPTTPRVSRSSSAPPDLPAVWRWGPPAAAATTIVERGLPGRTSPETESREPGSPIVPRLRANDFEPVPEPPPEIPASAIPADVEAMIPAPAPLPEVSGALAVPPAGAPSADPTTPVSRVQPVYPVAARALGAEGTVTLELTVRPDGSVEDAAVQACTRPGVGLEDAALAAVRRWRYPKADDSPRHVTVHVEFKGTGGGR